ncbi:arylsulfatase B-like [Saccoglossus kowalevskii]
MALNVAFNRTTARSIKLLLLVVFICIFMLKNLAASEINFAKREVENNDDQGDNDDNHCENDGDDDSCDVSGKQPHIVVVLIDDAGWNDVGWNNDFMPTPVLNELAYNGVILNNMYAQPLCTPSRIALLTGRYPAKVDMQHSVVLPSQPYYLPSEYSTLANKLKEVGYMNHVVGKWNIGSCNWTYTPLWRGFDSHYGCYEATISDYETHMLNWPRKYTICTL